MSSQAVEKQADKKPDHTLSDSEGEGEMGHVPKVPLRERLHHVTFAWYTLTMSTGGLSLLLALVPFRFPGLTATGTIFFIFDLVLQIIITVLLVARFVLFPSALRRALTEPPETIFLPTFFLSIAAILCNVQEYGVPALRSTPSASWLTKILRVSFWLYLALTFVAAVAHYNSLFTLAPGPHRLCPSHTTPAHILPIFPVMLAGTLGGFFAPSQPAPHAATILAAAAAAQGLGMLVSIFFYALWLARLLDTGLPDVRPAAFIAAGPTSFTAAALVSLGANVPRVLSSADVPTLVAALEIGDPRLVGEAVRVVCVCAAVFLWGLALWFVALALAACVSGMPDRHFRLSWWSFVFPNVGFGIATLRIGDAVGSQGLMWFGTVLAAVLVLVWMFVLALCVKAVARQEIVWPGKDEDSE